MHVFRAHRWLLLILLAFGLLGALRVNDLSLYTDSVRYLIWGTSIAQGKGWIDDTQPEPERYVVNAPFYPVLLAPVLVAFPLSLAAAKLWTVAWAMLGLWLFYLWLRPRLGQTGALIGAFLLAVNPMTVVLSSEALSEGPFLAFLMGIFLLMERVPEDRSPIDRWFWILAVLMPLVVLLREVAATVVAAAVLALLLRRRPKEAIIILVASAAIYGLWLYRNLVLIGTPATSQSTNLRFIFEHVVTPPEAPLAQEMLSRAWLNIRGFAVQLAGMLLYSVPTTLIVVPGALFKLTVNLVGWSKYLVFLTALPLLAYGFWHDLAESPTALFRALISIFYLLIILTYPIHDFRFLFPVLPLMVFYLLLGAQIVWRRLSEDRRRSLRWLPVALPLVLMIPNYVCLAEIISTNLSYRHDPVAFSERTSGPMSTQTFFSEPWVLMGDWIRGNTPDSCIIVSAAKEISTFVGDRKVLEINDGVPRPLFENMVRDNGAEYVLATGLWGDVTSYDFVLSESKIFSFEQVYAVSNLHLFRIHSRLRAPEGRRLGWTFRFDLDTPTGYLRKGRWELVHEEYDSASRSLAVADSLMPRQPVILFQQLLVRTFEEDSAGAVRTLEAMFSTSRSTPYIWAARTHVETMNNLLQARRMRNTQERAVALFDIARLYWNLGYEAQGYQLLRQSIAQDPGFFTALLWGWDYAMQSGDTAAARSYLATLRRIDPSNAVVRAFSTVEAIADTLRRARDPRERSTLRLHIANEYHRIELPIEALNEAERAIGEDTANADAWVYYGRLFNEKNAAIPARRAFARALALHPTPQVAAMLRNQLSR